MDTLIPKNGNYKQLLSYQKSQAIYDMTFYFCTNYIRRTDRTFDQMVQAARSGKQNIVEGASDGTVSMEMCLKLFGVARGSVMELREYYADYLRQHKHEIWAKDDPRTLATRNYCRTHYDPREFVEKCESRPDVTVANIMLTLIRQMEAMLAKVLQSLESEFLQNGGLKEAMARERRLRRGY